MMIQLFCSSALRTLLSGYLTSRGLEVGEAGEVALVERGQEPAGPLPGVVISFMPERLEHLTALFDSLAGRRREGLPGVISGWREEKDTCELIPYERILYFEAMGNAVYLVTPEQRLTVKYKLYELEQTLRPQGFIRVGKSQLVNVAGIREIIPWFGGRYILRLANRQELEVSRIYAKDFRAFLEL
jgi:hypothetical protein